MEHLLEGAHVTRLSSMALILSQTRSSRSEPTASMRLRRLDSVVKRTVRANAGLSLPPAFGKHTRLQQRVAFSLFEGPPSVCLASSRRSRSPTVISAQRRASLCRNGRATPAYVFWELTVRGAAEVVSDNQEQEEVAQPSLDILARQFPRHADCKAVVLKRVHDRQNPERPAACLPLQHQAAALDGVPVYRAKSDI